MSLSLAPAPRGVSWRPACPRTPAPRCSCWRPGRITPPSRTCPMTSSWATMCGSPPIPAVSPLLTSVVSRNLLLLQSLPTPISYRQDNVRRRKDAHRVGTAARGSRERLLHLPRRLPSDGGASRRVRRALSTRAGDRGQPTQHAPLPPGLAVQLAREECRGHRDVRRCRAPGSPRLHRYRALGSLA